MESQAVVTTGEPAASVQRPRAVAAPVVSPPTFPRVVVEFYQRLPGRTNRRLMHRIDVPLASLAQAVAAAYHSLMQSPESARLLVSVEIHGKD